MKLARVLLVASALLYALNAHAIVFNLSAFLWPFGDNSSQLSQELYPPQSKENGSINATLDIETNELTYKIDVTRYDEAYVHSGTAAQLYLDEVVGAQDKPIKIQLPVAVAENSGNGVSLQFKGRAILTTAQVADLLSGKLYPDMRIVAQPDFVLCPPVQAEPGVRVDMGLCAPLTINGKNYARAAPQFSGFAAPADMVGLGAQLRPANEIFLSLNPSESGSVIADFNPATRVLTYFATFSSIASGYPTHISLDGLASADVIPATMTKINSGLMLDGLPPAVAPVYGKARLSPEQAADLLAGKYYFSIHNVGYPGGGMRGPLTVKVVKPWSGIVAPWRRYESLLLKNKNASEVRSSVN